MRDLSSVTHFIVIVLILSITIPLFPYDMIAGIVRTNESGSCSLSLIVKKNFREELTAFESFEIERESSDREYYLLKKNINDTEEIYSILNTLAENEYDKVIYMDTPERTGYYDMAKQDYRRDWKWDILRSGGLFALAVGAGTVLLTSKTEENHIDEMIFATIPALGISFMNLMMNIAVDLSRKRHIESPDDIYDEFMNGVISRRNESMKLPFIEQITLSSFIMLYYGFFSRLYFNNNLMESHDYRDFDHTENPIHYTTLGINIILSMLTGNSIMRMRADNSRYYEIGYVYEQ